MEKLQLIKRVTEVDGRKLFLLGVDNDGRGVWLSEPMFYDGGYHYQHLYHIVAGELHWVSTYAHFLSNNKAKKIEECRELVALTIEPKELPYWNVLFEELIIAGNYEKLLADSTFGDYLLRSEIRENHMAKILKFLLELVDVPSPQ